MHIKLTDKAGRWTLWATETDAPDAKPIYSAWDRTPGQISALLTTILGEPPAATPAPPVTYADFRPEEPLALRKVAQSQALHTMLRVLDDWIDGARENHTASKHRGENRGEECWRTFTPADFRTMINDACGDLGVGTFPISAVTREDA